MDDDRGRQTEMRQSAVKTMRGILFAWMQQIDTVRSVLDLGVEHRSELYRISLIPVEHVQEQQFRRVRSPCEVRPGHGTSAGVSIG